MANRQAAVELSENSWTLIAEYTGTNPPRQVAVVNHADSANLAEVLVAPLHGFDESTPGGGDEGVPVLPGTMLTLTAHVPNGGGAVRKVWARSAGATVGVGEVMR